MERVDYLFIDGGYARRVYRKAMEAVFGSAGELSVQRIISQMEVPPFRTYYYDCRNRIRKNAESDADFNARVEKQEAYFLAIRSLRSVHVQLGTLTGARKRRQKEVDVQLAVDMLTHGFNRNMTHAVLLSGDLDFRPVVEALVRSGVFVAVWYENTSGSKKLYGAADFGQPLDWHSIHNWGDEKFMLAHPVPTRRNWQAPGVSVPNAATVKIGTYQGREALLIFDPNRRLYIIVTTINGLAVEHEDQGVLERYFSAAVGPIEWKPESKRTRP